MSLHKLPPPPLEPLVSEQDTPYPIEALPPVARDAAEAIATHVQAPIELTAPIVLSAISSIAQGRINAPNMDSPDGQPCSLFYLTLSDSGDGKSRCRNIAYKPIDDKQKEDRRAYKKEYDEYQESCKTLKGEALDAYLACHNEPKDPTVNVDDATYEAIAARLVKDTLIMSWSTDEAGGILCGQSVSGDNQKTVLSGLTKLFDNGTIDRVRSKSNADGSGVGLNRRFCMNLIAQESIVNSALSDPILRQQGFLPRFILAVAPSLAGGRFVDLESIKKRPEDSQAIVKYWNRCQELIETSLAVDEIHNEIRPSVIDQADEALEVQVDFHNEIESELGRFGNYEDIKAFGGRAKQIAVRLATVLAYFEGKQSIDHKTMTDACVLAKYSLDQWLSYSTPSGQRKVEKDAVSLMDWLKKPKRNGKWNTFNMARLAKDIRNGLRGVDELKPAVDYLVEKGYLFFDGDKTYTVNPQALGDAGSTGNAGNNAFTGLQGPKESREVTGNKTQRLNSDSVPASIRQDLRQGNNVNTSLSGVPALPATPAPICDNDSEEVE